MISKRIAAIAIATLLLAWIGDAHGQSSPSYEIARSVMSGGGGRSTSATYSLTGTLGQPSPVGGSGSQSYNLGSGFWGGMVKAFTVAIQNISYAIADGVRITWQSVADATYTIYYADTLSLPTVWNFLSETFGTGALMQWLDDGMETGTHPSGIVRRFYRILGEPGG